MKTTFDNDINRILKEGDREAFNQVYNRFSLKLYDYALFFLRNREDAIEIVQEVFVKIWVNRETILLKNNLENYLIRSTKNLILNFLRDTANDKRHVNNLELLQKSGVDDTEDKLLFLEYYKIAQKGISLLPQKRAEIFKLSTENGMSLQEIADHLNISKNVVRKQLYSATSFLREYLKQHAHFPFLISFFLSLFRHQ